MKPYGRHKKVKGKGWKVDLHLKRFGGMWWEGMCQCLSRGAIKHKVRKDINNQIEER